MIHAIETSTKYFEILKERFPTLNFYDGSWCHDACDSVESEEHKVAVYFPNTDLKDLEDPESCSTFAIFDIYEGDLWDHDIQYPNIESVIEAISKKLNL